MKLKTKQAAIKRFSISGRGKVRRRATHQAHFNSRETGNETRHKRGARAAHATDLGRIAQLLPYQ